jgi:O-methyltransferase involved in polyketide biosynthesis
METVRHGPGPYFLVAEAAFVYLKEPEVRAALSRIAGNFPRARIALDSASRKAITGRNKDFARKKMGHKIYRLNLFDILPAL